MFTVTIETCWFFKRQALKYLNILDNFNILTYVFVKMKEQVF